jgi:WD40 repeat protein
MYAVTGLAFHPDGVLAVSTSYGTLHRFDTATGDQQGVWQPPAGHGNCLRTGRKILAAGGEDGIVRLWDVGANALVGVLLGHVGGVSGVAFGPDGERLASSSLDGTVRLWELASGTTIGVLTGHQSLVRAVAFSPDGSLVASGGTDQTVRLWDAATGEQRAVLTGHDGEVESVNFSPDGAWLVSASADNTLRIWDVAGATQSGIIQGHQSFVLSAAFSPDGKRLASSSGDHTLRVWNLQIASGVASGISRFAPIGHGGWVTTAFSPDGGSWHPAVWPAPASWSPQVTSTSMTRPRGTRSPAARPHRRVTALASAQMGACWPPGRTARFGCGDPRENSWAVSVQPDSARAAGWPDPFAGD